VRNRDLPSPPEVRYCEDRLPDMNTRAIRLCSYSPVVVELGPTTGQITLRLCYSIITERLVSDRKDLRIAACVHGHAPKGAGQLRGAQSARRARDKSGRPIQDGTMVLLHQ